MNEVDLEHLYIICENVGANKDYNYSKLYLDVKNLYGKVGIDILENIQLEEEQIAKIWVLKNKKEYLEKLDLYKFDLKKVKYNQMEYYDFNYKWKNFYIFKGDL